MLYRVEGPGIWGGGWLSQWRTVTVAPMTTGSRPAPFRVPVTFQRKTGLILLDQFRIMDKSRLVRRAGGLSDRIVEDTLRTLREVFAD
ncbi:type II toxin-antitoxin system PemK/MazF family toxin [Cupriavidus necator]|uniref:type II toxin-antitoxin system PemK/MazF family toxin n=1 Tax=Cupriavidus necator TaxID=106590 RepID=UPI003F736705